MNHSSRKKVSDHMQRDEARVVSVGVISIAIVAVIMLAQFLA